MPVPDNLRTVGLREVIAASLLAALMFFSPPLFFIERYSLTAINKPLILGLILCLAVLFLNRFTITRTATELGFLQLAQASALLSLPFLHLTFGYGLDFGYFSIAFQILASLALFQVLANTDRIRYFATFWVNLHLLIGALGFLIFTGGVLFNIQPLGTFLDRPYFDFGLTYTNIFYQIGDVKLIRVAGFYDEPGTFAFYMTFSLLIARVFCMPRWKELLLIIFGLTSISMAFIVVLMIWLAFSVNKKSLKYLILIVGLLTVAVGRLDPDVRDRAYHVTVDRFSIAKSGGRLLKGDSRTPIMKDNFRAFVDAPVIGHGLHYEEYVGNHYRWSFIVNPVAPFATHGVLGAMLVNLHVIVLVIVLLRSSRLRRREKGLLTLILFAILAQRPVTINGFGYILFVIMIYELIRPRLTESYPEPA
jgi:hypothetical protein